MKSYSIRFTGHKDKSKFNLIRGMYSNIITTKGKDVLAKVISFRPLSGARGKDFVSVSFLVSNGQKSESNWQMCRFDVPKHSTCGVVSKKDINLL